MKRDLLTILDLTREEILHLLLRARELKDLHRRGADPRPLAGKTLTMIFDKPSTRTRVSFEAGMVQLGGSPLYLERSQTQLSRDEPLADTARVLSRYVDGVVIRTFGQDFVEEFARHAAIPVINGLTDRDGAVRQGGGAESGLGGGRQQRGQFLDHRGPAHGL
jgi:ornithine carbamoyltransferase